MMGHFAAFEFETRLRRHPESGEFTTLSLNNSLLDSKPLLGFWCTSTILCIYPKSARGYNCHAKLESLLRKTPALIMKDPDITGTHDTTQLVQKQSEEIGFLFA